MAKILLMQNISAQYLGLMYLSSALKQHDHKCNVLIGKKYDKEIKPVILKESPDIIGISVMTFSHFWAVDITKQIHRDFPQITIIFGGPHPTYFHDFIEEESVDIMLVGECEYAFPEIVGCLERGDSIQNIHNVHCKIDGKIYKNPIRPFSDINDIPFPDRELYEPYSWKIAHKETQDVITSRGCPFKCTYCYNNAAKEYYGNQVGFVRNRSVENVIEELIFLKKKINPEKITFADDFFGLAGKKWLFPFLEQYREKIHIPFFCNMRADFIANNPETCDLLKKANCFLVCFGIESGNEHIRNEVIKKKILNKHIIEAAAQLKKRDINLRTCNLLGIPGETIENIYETIEINQQIGTEFPHPYIFYPFPKTELSEIAVEKGLLKEDYYLNSSVSSFHHGSILDIDRKIEMENLHKFFQIAVQFPFLFPIIKKIVKFNFPKLNKAVFKVTLALKFKKYLRLSYPRAIINFFR